MLHRARAAGSSGHKPRLAGGLGAVRMSAHPRGRGVVRCARPIACEWLCHPIVSSVSVEVGQEAYLEPSPPFHRQPLFERDAAHFPPCPTSPPP